MKKLTINITPFSFSCSGIIYDTETAASQQITISVADAKGIADFSVDNNIELIELYGNSNYTERIRQNIETELKKYFISYSNKTPITVETKGVLQ